MHFWVSAEWTGVCSGHQNSRSSFYGIDRPQRLTPACDRAQQSPEWVVDWAQCWHSAETQVIRTGQTTASCMCIYKLKKKKKQVFGEVLLSRRYNGELATPSEMGKSSSISRERDGGRRAFTQYSHLSRHLIAVIQSDPKDCSVEKDCVVQR